MNSTLSFFSSLSRSHLSFWPVVPEDAATDILSGSELLYCLIDFGNRTLVVWTGRYLSISKQLKKLFCLGNGTSERSDERVTLKGNHGQGVFELPSK